MSWLPLGLPVGAVSAWPISLLSWHPSATSPTTVYVLGGVR